ncbi:MAG TPA: hypothetical protein VJT81_05690 [Burkholderiales bacterium]|nr:hypothetical protein [Burkholderiales bacterium]
MTTKRRIVEIAMHVSAGAFIVFAFVLLDMGAQALEAPETHGATMFVSFVSVGLAAMALLAELVALALRGSRM